MKKELLFSAGAALAAAGIADAAPSKPNILFILADDMGYGDVGVFHQNSRGPDQPSFSTPQLDRMAAEGRMLMQHYTGAPVCMAARASLLTGQNQGNCPIRNNQFDKAMPDCHTLATVLKQAGYSTMCIGKWGMQGKEADVPGHPLRHGFDQFFGYLEHKSGHTYYHAEKKPLRDGWDTVTEKYRDIYSTDLFTARAKKFIQDHQTDSPDQPFFMYLAYTAIHSPLQVPGGPYPSGSGLNGGVQWPLQPTPETRDTWLCPEYADAATDGKPWTKPMKRYATMTHRLDDGIGDLLQLLRDLHIDTNTLVVFSSDNGPSNSGGDPRNFDSWGPFDGLKRDCWEGGIHEPAIAWWPGRIAANSKSDVISGFWDWMPTFADLAGLPPPAQTDGVSLVPSLTGKGTQRERGYIYSEYESNLKDPVSADVFARKQVTGRGQQQFIRIGKWVGVRTQIDSADTPVRLYNIEADPHQDHNLAENPEHEDLVKRMTAMLLTVRSPNAEAPRPYDGALLPAVAISDAVKGKVDYAVYEGSWPWTPDLSALTPVKTGRADGLDLSVLPESGGVSFSGFVEVPSDGRYTLRLASNAGAQLWIHDAHVIADDFQNKTEDSVSIPLKAGLHPFRIFYRTSGGKPMLKLECTGAGETVPQPVLFFAAHP